MLQPGVCAGNMADMGVLAVKGVEFFTWWLIYQSVEDVEQYEADCRPPKDQPDVVCLHTELCQREGPAQYTCALANLMRLQDKAARVCAHAMLTASRSLTLQVRLPHSRACHLLDRRPVSLAGRPTDGR